MTDPFHKLVGDARAFLGELALNNTRDWFTANRARYDRDLKDPAGRLLEQVAESIGPDTGTKLFRPQRDVRFSRDKTPYTTHLHMLWTLPGGASPVGLFFGISPQYVTVGGGVMGFDKTALNAWRTALDGSRGAAIAGEIDALKAAGWRVSEPELKRVPAPHDKDHPWGEHLRRKSITVWSDLAGDRQLRPLAEIGSARARLTPLLDHLAAL